MPLATLVMLGLLFYRTLAAVNKAQAIHRAPSPSTKNNPTITGMTAIRDRVSRFGNDVIIASRSSAAAGRWWRRS